MHTQDSTGLRWYLIPSWYFNTECISASGGGGGSQQRRQLPASSEAISTLGNPGQAQKVYLLLLEVFQHHHLSSLCECRAGMGLMLQHWRSAHVPPLLGCRINFHTRLLITGVLSISSWSPTWRMPGSGLLFPRHTSILASLPSLLWTALLRHAQLPRFHFPRSINSCFCFPLK